MDDSIVNLSNKITQKVLDVLKDSGLPIDEAYFWQFLPLEIDNILRKHDEGG